MVYCFRAKTLIRFADFPNDYRSIIPMFNELIQSLNATQILSAFLVLFALIDVLGSLPVFIGLENSGKKIRPLRVAIVAFSLLLVFMFLGDWVLRLFRVDIASFAVAGAIVIFVVSIEMILGIEVFKHDAPGNSASLVPVAFPLIAGPATFTALLSMRAEYREINIIIALLLNLLIVFFVLKYMGIIRNKLGDGGVYVMRKFFGIVLMAIAVKLFASNIATLIGGGQ